MNNTTLPNTLNGLLAVAVNDARSINHRHYVPHFGYWHEPEVDGRCGVCLAGCVIARTLHYNRDHEVFINSFASPIRTKIEALDKMRIGSFSKAYRTLYGHKPSSSIRERLDALPAPAHPFFFGWRQFNSHLRSLELIIPMVRDIEASANR